MSNPNESQMTFQLHYHWILNHFCDPDQKCKPQVRKKKSTIKENENCRILHVIKILKIVTEGWLRWDNTKQPRFFPRIVNYFVPSINSRFREVHGITYMT